MYSTDNGGDLKLCSYACLWPVVWNYIVVRISLVGNLATISEFMNFARCIPRKRQTERGGSIRHGHLELCTLLRVRTHLSSSNSMTFSMTFSSFPGP